MILVAAASLSAPSADATSTNVLDGSSPSALHESTLGCAGIGLVVQCDGHMRDQRQRDPPFGRPVDRRPERGARDRLRSHAQCLWARLGQREQDREHRDPDDQRLRHGRQHRDLQQQLRHDSQLGLHHQRPRRSRRQLRHHHQRLRRHPQQHGRRHQHELHRRHPGRDHQQLRQHHQQQREHNREHRDHRQTGRALPAPSRTPASSATGAAAFSTIQGISAATLRGTPASRRRARVPARPPPSQSSPPDCSGF